MNRNGWRSLAILIVLIAPSACGVRMEERPEVRSEPPSGGYSAEPTTSNEATRAGEGIVYLVWDKRLVAARRSAEVPAEAVAALLRGPTADEARRGIRTAVPVGIAALDIQVRDRVATIDVPAELTDLAGTDQILAIAQLVYTVTENADVDGVMLMSADRQVDAPTDSGQLVSRPVTRADYWSVRPA